MNKKLIFASLCALWCMAPRVGAQTPVSNQPDQGVYNPCTGNPVIPAYLADATFYYDQKSKRFYAYGTNDGAGGGNVYPTQMWYSKDCKDWKNQPLQLPQEWIDAKGDKAIWAPSMIYHPVTDKYYLMYGIDCHTFVAMSDSPLGPWRDANAAAPGKMLYKGYDGQFFIDDDKTLYIVTDNGYFKIMKMKFDADGRIAFDNSDPVYNRTGYNEYVGEYKYKQVQGIRNMFEASYLYKRDGLYYLMWSFEGSENYNVRYAVSDCITGPYRQINSSMDEPILVRHDEKQILGPGHHSMFDYKGRTFIVYHRQHFPFVDSKRQTCIEELHFAPDGSILPVMPTHRGVEVVKGAKRYKGENLALGKPTLTSADRRYASDRINTRYRTVGIDFSFTGNYAVDENYGTHWDPGVDAVNPWIIIDLEKECSVKRIETIFEFTNRTYKYKLETLPASAASTLEQAAQSRDWNLFADKTAQGVPQSPVTDYPAQGKPKARYVKLTITDADVPPTADGNDPVNARNAWSVFEIRVF